MKISIAGQENQDKCDKELERDNSDQKKKPRTW